MSVKSLLATLIIAILVTQAHCQSECSQFYDYDDYEFRPQHNNHIVYPNVTCDQMGLRIQLVHNYYSSRTFRENSLSQIFYECQNATGHIVNSETHGGNYAVNDRVYDEPLPPSFTEHGYTCRVYGCYDENNSDSISYYYPIQNGTCELEKTGDVVETTDNTVSSTTSPESHTQPLTTYVESSLQTETVSSTTSPESHTQPVMTRDGDSVVYPELNCTNSGLGIRLVHNHSDSLSYVQLLYTCTDTSGNIISGEVSESDSPYSLGNNYHVQLNPSFSEPGVSCQVHGYYNKSDGECVHYLIQNSSCEITDSPTYFRLTGVAHNKFLPFLAVLLITALLAVLGICFGMAAYRQYRLKQWHKRRVMPFRGMEFEKIDPDFNPVEVEKTVSIPINTSMHSIFDILSSISNEPDSREQTMDPESVSLCKTDNVATYSSSVASSQTEYLSNFGTSLTSEKTRNSHSWRLSTEVTTPLGDNPSVQSTINGTLHNNTSSLQERVDDMKKLPADYILPVTQVKFSLDVDPSTLNSTLHNKTSSLQVRTLPMNYILPVTQVKFNFPTDS